MVETQTFCAVGQSMAQGYAGPVQNRHKIIVDRPDISNIGHDVGGFSGPQPDGELLLRWVQNGIFHPRFVIHSWNDDGSVTEPWTHPQVLPHIRAAIALRYRLLPYLYTCLWQAVTAAEPMLRPTFLDHETVPQCFADTDDFMLAHDHYKWRPMRWAGVPESHIMGAASYREKYDAFAGAMPRMLGNPVYHWSHLELWRHFGLEGLVLDERSADHVWNAVAEQLPQAQCSARGLLAQMNVAYVATTDDPCDSLEHHAAFAQEGQSALRMVPTFRPDPAFTLKTPNSCHGWSDWKARAAFRSGHGMTCFSAC